MHASHQIKLLNAGFTIYHGTRHGARGLIIQIKTSDNHNWHTMEKDFPSAAALKRRLHELDKKSNWIDLYDSKNNEFRETK